MNKPEDSYYINLQSRPQEIVSISIPKDTLESIKKTAISRDVTVEALLKFYIGQGLRQDLSKLFSSRIFEVTAQVLEKHLESEEEATAIIQKITQQVNQL